MLMEKTPDFWNSVIFSDEAMMELNCRRQNLVRRPNKKRYDPQFIVNSSNYPRKKIDGLGLYSVKWRSTSHSDKNQVDSDVYIKILKDNVVDFLYMHEPFQQDNAPAHMSLKTRNFFWENGFTILENWPPQSPNINTIENVEHFEEECSQKETRNSR